MQIWQQKPLTHAKLHKEFTRGSFKRIGASQYVELSEYRKEIAQVLPRQIKDLDVP